MKLQTIHSEIILIGYGLFLNKSESPPKKNFYLLLEKEAKATTPHYLLGWLTIPTRQKGDFNY